VTVGDWLLDSDPPIRWQVMRDLTDAHGDDVLLVDQRPPGIYAFFPNSESSGSPSASRKLGTVAKITTVKNCR
jgi:hypothetical protein